MIKISEKKVRKRAEKPEKTDVISTRIPSSWRPKVKDYTTRRGMTISALMREILFDNYL